MPSGDVSKPWGALKKTLYIYIQLVNGWWSTKKMYSQALIHSHLNTNTINILVHALLFYN